MKVCLCVFFVVVVFFSTAADAVTPAAEKVGRQKYLQWWVNTRRCMAFFTVCVCVGLVICVSVCQFGIHSWLLMPTPSSALLQRCRNSSPALLTDKSVLWQVGNNNWPPSRASLLLLLLFLLLELLNGVHLVPGAHVAHGGRVVALHHQLVGHLIVPLQQQEMFSLNTSVKPEKPLRRTNVWQPEPATSSNFWLAEERALYCRLICRIFRGTQMPPEPDNLNQQIMRRLGSDRCARWPRSHQHRCFENQTFENKNQQIHKLVNQQEHVPKQ